MNSPKRILVPTDFSAQAEAALNYGKMLAETCGASLLVLHVIEDPLPGFKMPDGVCPIKAIKKQLESESAEQLEKLLTSEERQKFRAELTAEWGIPYAKVLEFASTRQADLIVMGTHGRGAIERLVMGNVAERVVRLAPCPVLTIRGG